MVRHHRLHAGGAEVSNEWRRAYSNRPRECPCPDCTTEERLERDRLRATATQALRAFVYSGRVLRGGHGPYTRPPSSEAEAFGFVLAENCAMLAWEALGARLDCEEALRLKERPGGS